MCLNPLHGKIQSVQDYVGGGLAGSISFNGPVIDQDIYNLGNLSFDRLNRVFTNISDAMTNHMRGDGVAGFSKPASGSVLVEKACISVRWAWLAFPTGLVLLTICFFMLLVWETRPTGSRPDIWKSSQLALLYHGLYVPNDGHEGRDDGTQSVAGMEQLASGTYVQLGDTEGSSTPLETYRGPVSTVII